MAYENIRKKLNKYAKGGKMIPKYAFGSQFSVLPGTLEEEMKRKMLRQQQAQALGIDEGDLDLFSDNELNQMYMDDTTQRFDLPQPETDANEVLVNVNPKEYGSSAADQINTTKQQKNAVLSQQAKQANKIYNQYNDAEDAGNNGNLTPEQSASATQAAQNAVVQNQVSSDENFSKTAGIANAALSALGFNAVQTDPNDERVSEAGQLTMGIVSQAVDKTLRVADEITMGDKNFSARSDAADSVVHGASGVLMKSGNPYAMLVGAGLETLNFITKAGGKTVPGYDVNINNSGYGNLGHQESSSGRIWDSWTGKTGRKLAKRNEQARMALNAASISEDQAYEQEARANSITNVLEQNQIALAGGIDTSLLGN